MWFIICAQSLPPQAAQYDTQLAQQNVYESENKE